MQNFSFMKISNVGKLARLIKQGKTFLLKRELKDRGNVAQRRDTCEIILHTSIKNVLMHTQGHEL